MRSDIVIRKAVVDDATEMSLVVISSIKRVCVLDHKGDARIIEGWVANKTPSSFNNWIVDDGLYLNVAVCEGQIVGVGMCNGRAEILLCYVRSDFTRYGVGGGLIFNLEAEIAKKALSEVSLVSTKTAFDFYKKKGYVQSAENIIVNGVLGIPMMKRIR